MKVAPAGPNPSSLHEIQDDSNVLVKDYQNTAATGGNGVAGKRETNEGQARRPPSLPVAPPRRPSTGAAARKTDNPPLAPPRSSSSVFPARPKLPARRTIKDVGEDIIMLNRAVLAAGSSVSRSAGPAASMAVEVAQKHLNGIVQGKINEAKKEATGDTAGGGIEGDTSETTTVSSLTAGIKEHEHEMRETFRSLGHRVRIVIGYLQITAALAFSFDIPWPPMMLNLLKSLTFINFNFLEFFAPLNPCVMHTPFLAQAMFHMLILPLAGAVVVSAGTVAEVYRHKCRGVVWPKARSVLMTLIFLLFPGIVTRVFTTFKCKRIGDNLYLMADYSVVCWEGEHVATASAMFFFMVVYVFGIPLGSTLVLWRGQLLMDVDVLEEAGGDTSKVKLIGSKDPVVDSRLKQRALEFRKVYGSLFEACTLCVSFFFSWDCSIRRSLTPPAPPQIISLTPAIRRPSSNIFQMTGAIGTLSRLS